MLSRPGKRQTHKALPAIILVLTSIFLGVLSANEDTIMEEMPQQQDNTVPGMTMNDGIEYYKTQRYVEAENVFTAILMNSDMAIGARDNAMLYLTKTLYEQNKFNDIITMLEQFTSSNNVLSPELMFYYGTAYYKQGNTGVAIQWLTTAVSSAPEHALANFNLGIAYYKVEDYEKTKKFITKAIALDNTLTSRGYYLLGISAYKVQDSTAAVKWLSKLVQEFPYSNYLIPAENILYNKLGVKKEDLFVPDTSGTDIETLPVSKTKRYSLKFDITGGYDNNLNYLNLNVNDVQNITDDQYTLGFSGSYLLANTIIAGYSFNNASHPNNEYYNFYGHTGNIVWNYIPHGKVTSNVNYSYNYAFCYEQPLSATHTGALNFSFQEAENLTGGLSISYSQYEYLNESFTYLNGCAQNYNFSQYLRAFEIGFIYAGLSSNNLLTGSLSGLEYNYYYYASSTTWVNKYTEYYHPCSNVTNSVYVNVNLPISKKLDFYIYASRAVVTYNEQDRWYTQPVTNTWYLYNDTTWYEYVEGVWINQGTTGPVTPKLIKKKRTDVRDLYSVTLQYELAKNFFVSAYYSSTQNKSNFNVSDYEDKNYQKTYYYFGVTLKI